MQKVRGEDHVDIPWWAWLAVGAVMSVYAKTVEVKNPEAAGIALFFYIGIALGLFGLGKLVLQRKAEQEHQAQRQDTRGYQERLRAQQQAWQHQQQAQQQPSQHTIIRCPSCGAQHYATSNFCYRCGARLR